jgi:hypothetical protein
MNGFDSTNASKPKKSFNDLTPEEYHKIVEISTSIKKSYD